MKNKDEDQKIIENYDEKLETPQILWIVAGSLFGACFLYLIIKRLIYGKEIIKKKPFDILISLGLIASSPFIVLIGVGMLIKQN